jgi:hypothetical protein
MHTCMQLVPLEGGMPHITLLYYFTLKYSMVLEFYMESIEIMTLNFQVSKYYQLIQTRDKFITRWNMNDTNK